MPDPLATSLHTAAQVRAIDRAAIDRLGITGITLMERAAAAAHALLCRRWPTARRLLLLCGGGNNGGDAFLLGVLAKGEGREVVALATGTPATAEAQQAHRRFIEAGGRMVEAITSELLAASDVVIDGLVGTGLARPLEGRVAELVAAVAHAGVPVLALDLPSGLDADRGTVAGAVVHADATISFVAWKRGLFTADAADCCGECELATLDIPDAARAGIVAEAMLLDETTFAAWPPRARNVNKGSFGRVLVIGGGAGMGGAVRLCGEAALRCGAGLVTVATRAEHLAALHAARPELIAHAAADAGALAPLLQHASVLALGPGLGTTQWAHSMLDAALASGLPAVVDADALNLLAAQPRALPATCVLTPHPGEAARLLGCSVAEIQRDRFDAVRAIAARLGASVVLKGSGSLVAESSGCIAVCPWGNPGMASAGTGDVLTGVIAALLAQGFDAPAAARLGVALHARAGDLAAADAPRGLIASDLFAPLRRLANVAPA